MRIPGSAICTIGGCQLMLGRYFEKSAGYLARSVGCAPDLFRFIVVGLQSNLLYYLVYLGLTGVGVGAKVAASVVYVGGIMYSYVWSKNLVFIRRPLPRFVFARYVAVYACAWAINMLLLEIFVSRLSFDHRMVQAVLIVANGFCLFFALRQFVFSVVSPPDR